jgi:hypothetical protein
MHGQVMDAQVMDAQVMNEQVMNEQTAPGGEKPGCCGSGGGLLPEGNHLLLHYARLCIKRDRYGVKCNKTDDVTVALELHRFGCRLRL